MDCKVGEYHRLRWNGTSSQGDNQDHVEKKGNHQKCSATCPHTFWVSVENPLAL